MDRSPKSYVIKYRIIYIINDNVNNVCREFIISWYKFSEVVERSETYTHICIYVFTGPNKR